MKNFLFLLVPAMFLIGCAGEIEFSEPPVTAENLSETMPEIRTRSLEGAVYNEVIDVWMIPQENPFGLSVQTKKFTGTPPQPTHYALKIYPKNEEEQWRIEMTEDVQVAYIPFGYVQLTLQEVEKLPQAKMRSLATNIFAEKSPYTVTHEDYETTDGGSTKPRTFQLPILYVVWPIDKPLPEDLEYEIDHEIFKPDTTLSDKSSTRAFSGSYPVQLLTYDNVLRKNVPLSNLKVRAYTETYFYDPWGGDPYHPGYWKQQTLSAVTDSNGRIDIGSIISGYSEDFPGSLWCDVFFTATYQDPNGRWRITTEGSTAPLTNTNVDIFDFDPERYNGIMLLSSGNRQENEIFRAVNYYYNNQTAFPKYSISGGMKLIANNGPAPSGSLGSFGYPSCDINIYNFGGTHGNIIGTTLHEIGHFMHYNDNIVRYTNTLKFLRESFADYSGWYFGESYYYLQGWVKPYLYYDWDITLCAEQSWRKTNKGELSLYSPLFIDLTDNFNQRSYFSGSTNYPNDNILNVPASVIWNIIKDSTNWTQCSSKLQSYAGTGTGKYYTVVQLNNWIVDFNYWVLNNPNY